MLFVVDPWNYRLLLLIRGIAEAFNFTIERQVGERLQSVLAVEDEDASILPFFCFECSDGQRVAVAVDDIEAVNYLFESGIPPAQKPDAETEDDDDMQDVMLYFRNRPEPLLSANEDRERLDEIFEDLATDPFVVHKFISFTDEDGELLTFNAQHLVLFIAKPHDWSEEGEEPD